MKNNSNKHIIGIAIHAALLLVFAAGFIKVQAQQAPLFSSYSFNKFLNNPAFTGIDNEYRAFGFYRTQWTNMPGSPVTGGATAEGAFWKNRIGAGIYVFNDKIGIFNRTNAAVSYCQKIKFAKHHQIAIGVQGGIFVNRINFNGTHPVDYNDPTLGEQRPTKVTYDFNVGISYQWKKFLVGFSVPNILQPDSKYAAALGGSANYQYVRHYNVFAQYKINLLQGKFNITPTVVMRKAYSSGFQADATLLLDYKNMVFIGAGYRNAFGVIMMAGVNVLDMFTVAYAYDYTTQRVLKGNVGGTHEITAGFHIPTDYKRKKKDEPRDILGEGQSVQDLLNKNDTLSAKLKATRQKLDNNNKQVEDLNTQKKRLQNTVDSLQKLLQKGTPAPNFEGKGEKNATYKLNEVYFNQNEYALLPEARAQLEKLAEFMAQTPDAEIIIKGYTDNSGREEYNRELSQKRADAVMDYLAAKGIERTRLSAIGYGNQYPVGDNTTEEGRRMNRRVEFTVK